MYFLHILLIDYNNKKGEITNMECRVIPDKIALIPQKHRRAKKI